MARAFNNRVGERAAIHRSKCSLSKSYFDVVAAVNTCTPLTCVQDVGVISIDRGNNAEAEELRNHAIRKHRVDGLPLNVYSQPRGS